MNEATARPLLTALQEIFFNAWSTGQWQALSPSLAPDAMLTSSQHGEGSGAAAWREALADDAAALRWMRSSNHAVVVGENGQAATSAYVFGLFSRGQRQFLFGASVVLRFDLAQGQWLLIGARINVNWCKGDVALASHWRAPPKDVGWQLGDPVPAIVSEIDSPWALIGKPLHAASEENGMRELYSKYSWAIDQGDVALLSDCYTDDAAGGFTPIGPLQGRHAIIGQLKSFRRLWPWMQHFADVVRLEPEADGHHARMIVGRIVPESPVDETGASRYGAHYQLRLRRGDDGLWRFCWSDYRPGWFSAANPPAFDIGVTHD
jgi:ketosteroid isomerase-like protein